MLNIASFLTPLAVHPDPNGGVANALHGRQLEYSKQEEANRLGEQTRHSKELENQADEELGFRKQEHADTMGEHERQLHTKLTEWAMGVLDKEGLDKAREIAGPVLDAAGIGVDFGQPGTAAASQPAAPSPAVPGAPSDDDGFAKLQAAQAANAAKEAVPSITGESLPNYKGGSKPETVPNYAGDSEAEAVPNYSGPTYAATPSQNYGIRPGESMSQYIARGKEQAAAEPTEKELGQEATEGPMKAENDELAQAEEGAPQKWRIYNKRTGETYGLIDPAKVQAINQERAYKGATSYVEGTPESGKPIVKGFLRGARDEADLEKRMGHAERAISEQEKTLRVEKNHKGGGGMVPIGGPIDEKLLNQVNGQVRMYVSKAVDNSGVKALNTKGQDSARIAGMISSGSSGAERQAFATQLHANFGAASSEGERAFQLEQAGIIQSLLAKVDAWVQSGQLPEGLKNEIQTVAKMQQDFARKYADEIRRKATKDVMESPALGGLYDRALGHQLSPEEREKIAAGVSNLGGIEGSEPAETGSADHEFDKLGL